MNSELKNTRYKSLVISIENKLGSLPGDADDYMELYKGIPYDDIAFILCKLHAALIKCFQLLNHYLPTSFDASRHFHAENSRTVIATIETVRSVERLFKKISINFTIEEENKRIIDFCESFLERSGGSEIPPDTEEIILYYSDPIFFVGDFIDIPAPNQRMANITSIGEGGYATVHKFKDPLTNISFVIKKAKADLDEKEIERFKIEYQTLKGLSSPYIVDVYSYNESENSYLMEKMDFSLEKFLGKAPSTSLQARKSIGLQIIKGFNFLHSKGHLHRDISTSNILIKQYEDGTIVAKIADFGLVKTPESNLTTSNTTMKGPWYNDPELLKIGFNRYEMKHELYAIVRLLYFVLTGRSTLGVSHRNETTFNRLCREFVEKGTSSSAEERFPSLLEVKSAFLQIFKDSQESEV